jgi:hypothetical protein
MEQTLDLQVAALIFLTGTRCLVTSEFAGDAETTNETKEEDMDEPAPITLGAPTDLPFSTRSPWFQQ